MPAPACPPHESVNKMNSTKGLSGEKYRIVLKGKLNPAVAEWLGEVSITPLEHGETVLVGEFIDQPALRGFLEQLWNRNFTVFAVERLVNGE